MSTPPHAYVEIFHMSLDMIGIADIHTTRDITARNIPAPDKGLMISTVWEMNIDRSQAPCFEPFPHGRLMDGALNAPPK